MIIRIDLERYIRQEHADVFPGDKAIIIKIEPIASILIVASNKIKIL